LANGFMMMGVAFLLERRGVVVDSQTVADEDAAEVFSDNLLQQFTSATLNNDVEGQQLGSKNPQPPARTGDPPAGLITMKRRCLAQFCGQGVVLGFDFESEPIKGLGEAAGAELQAKTIAQNGAGFAHGKPFGLVKIGSQSEGSWTDVHTGRAACN
jgi:hypothetical protein